MRNVVLFRFCYFYLRLATSSGVIRGCPIPSTSSSISPGGRGGKGGKIGDSIECCCEESLLVYPFGGGGGGRAYPTKPGVVAGELEGPPGDDPLLLSTIGEGIRSN